MAWSWSFVAKNVPWAICALPPPLPFPQYIEEAALCGSSQGQDGPSFLFLQQPVYQMSELDGLKIRFQDKNIPIPFFYIPYLTGNKLVIGCHKFFLELCLFILKLLHSSGDLTRPG